MNRICSFCNQPMKKIDHVNKDMLDIFLCEDCLKPNFTTRFRQVFYSGDDDLLAIQFELDEFHVILNYHFDFNSSRTNYTKIYKNIVGSHSPACDLDTIPRLPFHDPYLLKQKLRLYTLFS